MQKILWIIRVVAGILLLLAWLAKFGGMPWNIDFVGWAAGQLLPFLEIIPNTIWFWIATLGEILAGAALILWYKTRNAALIAAVIMIFAWNATGWGMDPKLLFILIWSLLTLFMWAWDFSLDKMLWWALSTATGAVGSVAGWITDVAKGAVDAAGSVASWAVDAAGSVAWWVADAAGSVAWWALDAAGSVASWAVDAAGSVAWWVADAAGSVAWWALDAVKWAWWLAWGLMWWVADMAWWAIDKAWDMAKGAVSAVADKVDAATWWVASWIIDKVEEVAWDMIDKAEDVVEDMVDWEEEK